ncbi:G5 domain-containing protein, partial [Facklamia languida]
QPVPEIVEVGTKVVTEDIPFETEERKNPDLPEGERNVIQEGKPGKKNVHTGEVITEPVNEIIEIGTKVITEEIPYETEERENPELPEGERNVIQEGKTGKKNVHTGEVIEQPVPEIVEVGTKVVTEDIPFEKEERENPELPEGERKVIQEGKLGKKNVHTGEVITEPVNEIIEIGTKVITEEIPYETEERKNPELPEGERKVIQEGKSGKKNVHTGEIIDEPVKEIVEIGTKVITEEIPFETEERENPELPEGESNVIQEGKPGKKNVHTGEVIEAPTPEIVEIGTKVITEDIPYETEQHENPDLPEGERKVIQEGKPGKKNQYTGEVIEQPTPEIVEIGTKVITEDIPFETEERENPDLPEGERKVIQEGKPGKKNVHTGEVITEPVNEIIELGTKEDKLVEWDVPYKVIPLPSPKLKETVVETRHALNTDVKDFYDRLISENSDADSSSTDELTDDQKAQVLASALDYYRKAMGDENIKLEQLITDSADKKGSFYETLVLAGANKLGITEIEKDQEPDYYKNILLENKAYDGKQIYKDIVVQENSDGTLTSGTPSPEAMETVTKNLEEIEELLEFGHGVFINYVLLPEYQNAIRSTDIPEEDKKKLQAQLEEIKNFDKLDTTAASLDFYRVLTNKPEATLQDVLIDWAQSKAGLTLTGALEMVNRYDSSVGGGTDTLNVYKKLMRTRHGQLMESEWTFFTDPFFKILEGIGETVEP